MTNGETKKGLGCLFYGCLTVVILGIFVMAGITFGIWKLKEFALSYTDTMPREFAGVSIPTEKVAEFSERIDAFSTAVKEGKNTGPLVLTAEEVNALIYGHMGFKELKGGIQVSFSDDKIKGQVSIPLDKLLFGLGEGRYLNGSASFNVSCENGVLIVALDSLEVKGKQVPEIIMSQFRNENLAKDLYKDVESAKMIKRLKRIQVRDGKLIIEAGPEISFNKDDYENEWVKGSLVLLSRLRNRGGRR